MFNPVALVNYKVNIADITMTMQEKQDTNSGLKSSTISLVCILVTSFLGQGPLEI